MGKTKNLFMENRENDKRKYPIPPINEFSPVNPCPDCDGWGFIAESKCCGSSIINGICTFCAQVTEPTLCTTCQGDGSIPKSETDFENEKENEIIGNKEMMKDE
jgi:hypothetical protein